MLDTMRVLVEHGAVDPAETTQPDFNYETAISLFNLEVDGTVVEALEYLLHQVDTGQVEDLQWSSWLLSPDLTFIGQELVISHLTRLACLSQNHMYMESTFGCLAMNMIRMCHIEQFSREDLIKWCKIIFWKNLNILIAAKKERQEGFDYWTALRFLSNPFFEVFEDVKKRVDEVIHVWLLWLEECGVNNRSYLEEKHDFSSFVVAYPLALECTPTVEKEGKVRWQIPEMIERFIFYDFTHVDLNESHAHSFKELCRVRNCSYR
ncbi:MAG: hypothetical protein Q9167_003348 [Letrouitia subvulpina]